MVTNNTRIHRKADTVNLDLSGLDDHQRSALAVGLAASLDPTQLGSLALVVLKLATVIADGAASFPLDVPREYLDSMPYLLNQARKLPHGGPPRDQLDKLAEALAAARTEGTRP